jgi:hypothetical protein
MDCKKMSTRGFTLIASLLMLLLLSGIAIGLLMMVNTETRVGGNDLENNLAYHAAEGAIEKMTSDLASQFQNVQAPTAANITALSALRPTNDPYITYTDYSLTPALNPDGSLFSSYGIIHSGSNQGLYAQIIPVTLRATAQRPLGDQVSMMRTVEVALIPVFQFGVFSDSDLGFFSSPNLDFRGRVHTNGDLYIGVADSATISFHDRITAYGDVIRKVLPNGLDAASNNDNGTVNILAKSGGCDMMPAGPAGPDCKALAKLPAIEGSILDDPATRTPNPIWDPTTYQGKYNGWILNGAFGAARGVGAKALTLPFTSGGAQPFEIIRRPPAGEAATSAIGQARLANQAQIRVLLADTPAANHLDGSPVDANDVQLVSQVPAALTGLYNAPAPAVSLQNGVVIGGNTYYMAEANTNCAGGKGCDANYVQPTTYHGAPFPGGTQEWPLIDGFLRVEYKNNLGAWVGVTQEWLNLGFARGLTPPNSELGAAGANPVHQNAILIFQMRADRNGDGQLTNAGDVSTTVSGANSQYNWLPINFYDTREGEVRDWAVGAVPGGASSCAANGVMNAVELDVGNLRRWLRDATGSGPNVNFTAQNGYVLYFSDRRGMRGDPNNGNQLMGEYGFEDTINTGSGAAGTPNGSLEAPPAGRTRSPEDVNGNGRLDTYGAANVGDGFGVNTNTAPPNPYNRIANCYTTARKNRVTGARHALKLVNGTMGNVPTKPDASCAPDPVPCGGFTVASENPVYIQGNYNSHPVNDPTWANPAAAEPAHAAAGIIADTVTLLSSQWLDTGYSIAPGGPTLTGSLLHPTDANTATGYRQAVTTAYRVAIAAGKTINFPHPGFANNNPTYFGTDGGLHNFLRFLENWNGDTLYYKGSLVSLFYSTYGTGTFKCCNYMVYQPPIRNYSFDPLFAQPKNLPPGTPMFRDVDSLSYRQDFTPH